jgi:hypothetical protein
MYSNYLRKYSDNHGKIHKNSDVHVEFLIDRMSHLPLNVLTVKRSRHYDLGNTVRNRLPSEAQRSFHILPSYSGALKERTTPYVRSSRHDEQSSAPRITSEAHYMMITMISPPLEALRVDDDVVARTEVPALDGMARDRHICLYYPPPPWHSCRWILG